MKYYGKIKARPLHGPLFFNKKFKKGKIWQVSQKHGSRIKYFNKDADTSGSVILKSTFQRHQSEQI